MRFGYTLLTEQSGPRELVDHARSAEHAGFDFLAMSDHYFPWLRSQGHSSYAWSLLGAVTQMTRQAELMSFVTAPIMRYHPAVVAQKAATLAALSEERFTLGLGAGENLNEHILGRGWPPINVRHDMLAEAVAIISGLLEGNTVSMEGHHFRVDSAYLWDLPEQRVPIGVAISGKQSIAMFATSCDAMIATTPDSALCREWDHATSGNDRKIGQLPICWDRDHDTAVARAHDQFRWFAGGWKVNSELPAPGSFEAATHFVRPGDVAASIPCGPDTDPIVSAARNFRDAGFSDLALVQAGVDTDPEGFFRFAENELLPALRKAAAPH
ncbi:TIGR03557 family F420-dependent LLM class oxidoreductase [Salinifilum ghardaiensis]